MFDKLVFFGVLIMNFLFLFELIVGVQKVLVGDKYDERREIIDLLREYLKYRFCNILCDENYDFDLNVELFSEKIDEEIYSDYIIY